MIHGRFFNEVFVDEIYKPVRERGSVGVVLDVGSTTGEFSLWVYPQAKTIYALEPASELYPHLRENVKELPKINPFNLALSDINGDQRFYDDST